MEDEEWWQTGPPWMYELPWEPEPYKNSYILIDRRTQEPTQYPPLSVEVEVHDPKYFDRDWSGC
jgi:hypothetical protein